MVISIGIFLVAGMVYAQFGFNGSLPRDNAFYLYIGQLFAKGIPPYIGVYDSHTPLGPMVIGAGSYLAYLLSLDQILTARILFYVISCLTVSAIYLLGTALFNSHRVGIFSALIFLSFSGFAQSAAYGPQVKTLMVLFQVLVLLQMTRKAWFWAGVYGTLAFLTWQPLVIFPITAIVLAYLQTPGTQLARRNALFALFGSLIPLLVIIAYFLTVGAFQEFVESSFIFPFANLLPSRLENASLIGKIIRPFLSLSAGFATTRFPIVLGFGMIGMVYLWRIRESRGVWSVVTSDKFAPFLLTFPAPALWSLLDFQAYADFFPFLPYLAVVIGWLGFLAIEALIATIHAENKLSNLIFIAAAAVLVIGASTDYLWSNNQGLVDQRAWAEELESKFLSSPDAKMLNIGGLEALVILGRTSPHPYINMFPGISDQVEQNSGESLEDWFVSELSDDPEVVFLNLVQPKEARTMMVNILIEDGYIFRKVGQWFFYAKLTNYDN